MSYTPQSTTEKPLQALLIHEPNPRMVTPLSQLAFSQADVDCPYCKKVVTTEVREVSSDDDG